MKISTNETFRDKIQDNWAETFVRGDNSSSAFYKEIERNGYKGNTGGEQKDGSISYVGETKGILHLCPRSGKIRTCIRIFCKIHRRKNTKLYPTILIAYPDVNIRHSWESDFTIVGYKNPNIDYTTHISLGKTTTKKYDIIVCDEIHLLSAKQKSNLKELMDNNKDSYVIGLSGTLSKDTEKELAQELKLKVKVKYTLEEAIRDGVISDYRINVIKTKLDDNVIVDKKKNRTEKGKYRALTWIIENKGPSLFLNLARMRVIHNSIAKTEETKKLLNRLKNERILVFCANNKVAKQLGCQIHTASFNNQEEFEKFIGDTSKHNHLAVCKIGNTGVSFKSLNHIVINAFDSNSENLTQRICRSLILDEKDKVSNIYIVTSDEKAELKWLEKALEFFDKKKIQHL